MPSNATCPLSYNSLQNKFFHTFTDPEIILFLFLSWCHLIDHCVLGHHWSFRTLRVVELNGADRIR